MYLFAHNPSLVYVDEHGAQTNEYSQQGYDQVRTKVLEKEHGIEVRLI
jgi:hypothetical protein